jgi:VanZ family protein
MKWKIWPQRILRNPALAWGCTLLIAVLCLMPSERLVVAQQLNDKVEHLLAFGALAFVWRGAGRARQWVALSLVLYGLAIEMAQGMLPASFHRSADVRDALADALGVLLGLILYEIWEKI